MAIKIAINGFGRIGRLAFRQMIVDDRYDIVAINGSRSPELYAHLLKYDSCHGNFMIDEVEALENAIKVGDTVVDIVNEREPINLPWKELGVDIVLDCTGKFKTFDTASQHIEAGAKKVIISAPGKEMKTVVFGVNEDILTADDKVISASSCTTNCLAPVAKILDDNFGIKIAYMTTVHAYTNEQLTLDKSHKDFRRARAAAINIIPTTTGAAKSVGLILPKLKGKIDGYALRVPVATGSLVDLTCEFEKDTTVEEIQKAFIDNKSEIVGCTNDPIVSTDIIGMRKASLVDLQLIKDIESDGKKLFKIVSWYDNEMSYTTQMVRLCEYVTKL